MKTKKFYNLIYSNKNKISLNDKNLFIGKWLNVKLLNKDKKNIEFYNHEWLNQKKQIKDAEKVKKIYIKVLNNLTSILNKYHSINFNLRQWEIILFFFLYHYIPVAYDRWNMIKSIKKKYRLRPIELISHNSRNFECKNSIDAFDLTISHEWNEWMISEIIKKQELDYFSCKVLPKKNIFKRKFQKKESKKKLFRFKKNNNKYFLTNLELPRIQKLKLNLKLNQFNFFYDQPSTHSISSISKRTNKIKILKSSNNFVNFITENIYKTLPRNFLENFKEIEKKINSSNWPKNPKVIMTSYSHYTDEIFCIYTAKKIKEGAKFVILQHGHQGHHDFCGTYYEKRVCDKYLTWGNKSKDKKTIPLFVSTVMEKNIKKKTPLEF